MALAAGFGPAAVGCAMAAVASQALAFDRIVVMKDTAPRPSPWAARGVLLARLSPTPAREIWCLQGGSRPLRVAVASAGHEIYDRCQALRVTGHGADGRPVTFFSMAGGSFWARPAGGSRGVAMRALGRYGVFRKVTLVADARGLVVSAQAWAEAARARYRIYVKGTRVVRMEVTERVRYQNVATGVRDRPALAAFYDYGVANHMPTAAVDLARHDADGLWLDQAGSISWLPLRNPPKPWSRAFGASVRGVGLVQRNRALRYFGVHVAREQDAPDVFVRWTGRGGAVVLRERPSAGGGGPNIGVIFAPGGVRATGHGWTGRYRLVWEPAPTHPERVAVVVSSLIGGNADTGARKYVIDYAGGPLEGRYPIGAVAGGVRVRPDTFVTQDTVGFNPYTGGYRQVVQVMPVPGRTVQVRAWLNLRGQVVSEIWRYALFAPRVAH